MKGDAVRHDAIDGGGRGRPFPYIRWTIIALFVVAMVINYLTRSILGVAAPAIMAEQHISSAQYSWITGAFQFGIMFQPVAGYLLDLIGLKIGFSLFVAVWSLITLGHGFANGWLGFAGLRGALGLVEGSAQPAGMKVVAEWFPARERGVAGGIYQIGASFGAVFAPPLVAWAVFYHSWRAAFFVAGGLGLLWVVAWLFWYATPARHPRLSARERALIVEGQEASLAKHRRRPPLANCCAGATSGRSRPHASWPIRSGACCRSGCRSISSRRGIST